MLHSSLLVRQFHQAFGHPVREKPMLPSRLLAELRVRIIAEELSELARALNVRLRMEVYPPSPAGADVLEVRCLEARSEFRYLVAAADALGDLDYVVQGTNVALGIPAYAVVYEVHRSNMSKLGSNNRPLYRHDGKVLKGPNYTPPDLSSILSAAGRIGTMATELQTPNPPLQPEKDEA